ncbi:restriction endonuclease subunit S [Exiguobacterium sp. SL-10]|uniref:restriction endonuclease subunit S n=1 Tax=Exiguobacterium sp. SL-10 TaxID=2510962 RepID=UPI0010397494|nr:restriction endonuclease subunit S [Exiguobacterium sp. SL-10]TCI29283.1 restriction endonuclease subunit S [Exiguobacterium sp. SL-10]
MSNVFSPKLRFKEFKKAWKIYSLKEVADFFNEKRIPIESEKRVSGEYPYYGATGIIDYVDNYILEGEYVLLAEDGANIITRNSPIAYLTGGKFWVNNHAHIMQSKNGSNTFLAQVLENQNYVKYNSGTAQPKLNSQVVKGMHVILPEVKEQTKIGSFFKDLDDTIALHQQELEALKKTKQGFLQKMFPKDGDTIPKVRLKGFTDEWTLYELKDVATFINGRAYKQNELLDSGKYKVLRVGNFYTNTSWYYSDLELGEKYYANYDDLLYTWSASFGPHIWKGDKVIYHYHIWRVDLKNGFDKHFIVQLFEYDKAKIMSDKNGSTMVHITKKGMEEKIVRIPSYDEQIKIGELFRKLDEVIELKEKEIDALKETKKGFLQKMFV